MKKKLFFGFLALTTAGILTTSCSESEEEKTNNPITNPNNPSNPSNPNNPDNNRTFVHKVLIEDVTGTWCQWCPRVTYAIEKVLEHQTLGDKIIPVAIHSGDVMQINAGSRLDDFFQVDGYPFALINRSAKWSSPQNNKLAEVYNAINQAGSPVGISINSQLTNTGGTITANFKFNQGYENLKYHMFIIENGVVLSSSPQKNSTTFYGGSGNANSPSQHPDFVHNDVLRAVAGTTTGNELGTVTAGQEISKQGSVTYNLYQSDLSKVEVVVFVTDNSGKAVYNVQKAHANQNLTYQYIN